MKEWLEVSAKLFHYLIALYWNGILGYMLIADQDIPAWFWAIYGPVMAVVGIPIAWQGIKAGIKAIGKISLGKVS